ncbi:sulfatase-like hydrolase/transferase [Halosimplex aquaticum]|uniref:Sulfatase-like hydrolase/transferase n=1 Tax=Halosimplex aquaticum TaxID=3026162 RepID=A0ABD5Y374_9EURY|nr:sulfatase-like hydrolase/transferase [Halosimplex aquaticum]
MEDIVLVTADSVRRDYADAFESLSDLPVQTGVTGSHYTRPSLASLISANYRGAITTEVVSPTIAEVLSDAGYTCLGYTPTPNTDARFGFDRGFDDFDTFVEPGNRGSKLRQYLGSINALRWIYYKIYPPQAKSENRPRDREVIERAIEEFNAADGPRFLWVHLMETHRPYGVGDEAMSKELDQKAFFKPDKLTDEEEAEIEGKYADAIRRADENIDYLLSEIDSDPILAVTSDHGEGFGEDGFYFHQGHKRSVADFQTKVPVIFDGIDAEGPMSLLDVPPTLVESVGVDAPASWHGTNLLESESEYAVTIAPWHDTATVAWRDYEKTFVARDADVSFEEGGTRADVERADVDQELEEQLQDLGYMDAG